MITFVKGDPDDLEGRATIYAAQLDNKPFSCLVHGSLYPSLTFKITPKESSFYLHTLAIGNLSQETLNEIVHFPGDVLKIGSYGFSRDLVLDELTSAQKYYTTLFIAQDQNRKDSSRRYGLRFDNPKKLSAPEYKAVVMAAAFQVAGHAARNDDFDIQFEDLQYLTKNAPFRRVVLRLGLELFKYREKPTEKGVVLVALLVSKIEAILQENFEKIPSIDREIELNS